MVLGTRCTAFRLGPVLVDSEAITSIFILVYCHSIFRYSYAILIFA